MTIFKPEDYQQLNLAWQLLDDAMQDFAATKSHNKAKQAVGQAYRILDNLTWDQRDRENFKKLMREIDRRGVHD